MSSMDLSHHLGRIGEEQLEEPGDQATDRLVVADIITSP